MNGVAKYFSHMEALIHVGAFCLRKGYSNQITSYT